MIRLGKKKVKVGKDDVRVGNFIFHSENGYVKVMDLSGFVSHRISGVIPKGRFVLAAMQDSKAKEQWLHNYAAVMFNVLSCVPDAEFFERVNTAATECVQRHPELYGLKPDISDEEDKAIVESQRELDKAMSELKEGAE